MRIFAASIVTATCLATTLVWAHGKATGIVRERMDQMVVLKDAMKRLKTELVQGEEYDSTLVLVATKEIKDHSGEALLVKFPADSLTKHSEALPSVWDQPDQFAALAQEMGDLATAMAVSVEAGVPNVKSGSGLFGVFASNSEDEAELRSPIDILGLLASTCRDCHDDYRKR